MLRVPLAFHVLVFFKLHIPRRISHLLIPPISCFITLGGGFNISPLKPRNGRPRAQVQHLMQIDLKGWGVGYFPSFQQHCLLQMLNSVAGIFSIFINFCAIILIFCYNFVNLAFLLFLDECFFSFMLFVYINVSRRLFADRSSDSLYNNILILDQYKTEIYCFGVHLILSSIGTGSSEIFVWAPGEFYEKPFQTHHYVKNKCYICVLLY